MKVDRRTKILVVAILVCIAIGAIIWIKLIKFSWCQISKPPFFRKKSPVVISLDRSGLDESLVNQARSIIHGVTESPKGWKRAGYSFVINDISSDIIFHLVDSNKLGTIQNCSRQDSCRVGNDIYINLERWRNGSPHLTIPLDEYRAMIINHELGHWLGFEHWRCYGHGVAAPVMQQQSISLGGLIPSAWPNENEIKSLLSSRPQ